MLQADLRGNLRGTVVVPANLIQIGARELVLTGRGGSEARAVIHFQDVEPPPTHERPFDQAILPVGSMAVAQTFQLPQSRYVRQIQVKFCAIPEVVASDVICQIRETENGLPTHVVLGHRVLRPELCNTSGWTTFQFEPPVPLIGGIEYCFLLITADPAYTLAIGQQGHYVNAGDGPTPPYPGWITQQPYQVGVCLVSSNIDTWTPMQDTDLVFRITGCLFSPTSKDVDLGNVTPDSDETDAMVRAVVHRPFGTADCQFLVRNIATGETHTDLEFAKIRLNNRLSGDFNLTARLSGDAHASPLLFPNGQLELGNLTDSADYVTVPIDAGDEFNLTMIFDALRSGNSAITPYVAVQRYSGGNPVIIDGVYQWDWVQVTNQITAHAIGNGWNEETWRVDTTLRGILPDYQTRLKIHLSGGPTARPIVKNLRAITILAL